MPYEPVGKLDNIEEHSPEPELAVMLDSNEAFYNLNRECPAISEKIAEEVRNLDFSRYPDPYYKRLTTALSDYYGISPEYITVGNGADELTCLALSVLFQKGDMIVTLSPDFSM